MIIGDLKNPQAALEVVEGVDVVFHFAANPEVRASTTNPEEYLRISSFKDLMRTVLKKPTKLNILRLSAYP